MAPSPSPEHPWRGPAESAGGVEPAPPALAEGERRLLLELADAAIRRGLEGAGPPAVDVELAPAGLRVSAGAFVTVTVAGELNGCIGVLWPSEPLCAVVPRLAWEAAFADPRLPRLTAADYPRTGLKVSVLSVPRRLDVASEAELVAALRPGVDGLVLSDGVRQATFLPAVWETIPDPARFVHLLEAKAGVRWTPRIAASRYTTAEFGEHDRGARLV